MWHQHAKIWYLVLYLISILVCIFFVENFSKYTTKGIVPIGVQTKCIKTEYRFLNKETVLIAEIIIPESNSDPNFDLINPRLNNDEMVLLPTIHAKSQEISKIDIWKARFDMEWRRAKPFYETQLLSNGPEPNRYYDFRVIDALIAMLQATGDTKYMDNLIWYIDDVKNLATKSKDGYYDWPNNGINYQLYDGHGLRNVFKILWILKKYPDLKSMSNYQAKYDEWLPWFTTNVWDKWKSRGCRTILRSNTHMASHLGSNVALYLHLLEDEQKKKAEYRSWLNAWNTDVNGKCRHMGKQGIGFRDKLRTTDYGGYIWSNPWIEMEGSTDVSHANADVQSVVNQFHQGIEWTPADIKKFIKTFNCILDSSPNPDYANLPEFLHSKYSSDGDNRPFVSHGWTMLGRFDRQLHRRLYDMNSKQFRASHYYNNFIGNMTYNQAYLDEVLVYPEF